MKKIISLVTSIILILSLSSKSHSFTNNDEFINFKKSNEIFCKKLNSPILGNIEKNWKLEKKNKYFQLFINQMD
ncbi:MAG: hypothetical protein L7T23_07465, partial [Alphaproteobacteria bacterium]|nr:hypothetical protein [Alphaproteobacteria bacterium]